MQHLSFLAVHTNPFAGSSYCGDDACGTRKKATTDWPSEQQVVLEGDTVLPTFCSKELSLEKAKLPPSSFSFRAPVATLNKLNGVDFAAGDQCLRDHVLELGGVLLLLL